VKNEKKMMKSNNDENRIMKMNDNEMKRNEIMKKWKWNEDEMIMKIWKKVIMKWSVMKVIMKMKIVMNNVR